MLNPEGTSAALRGLQEIKPQGQFQAALESGKNMWLNPWRYWPCPWSQRCLFLAEECLKKPFVDDFPLSFPFLCKCHFKSFVKWEIGKKNGVLPHSGSNQGCPVALAIGTHSGVYEVESLCVLMSHLPFLATGRHLSKKQGATLYEWNSMGLWGFCIGVLGARRKSSWKKACLQAVFIESTLTLYLLLVGPKLMGRLWELTFPTSVKHRQSP